MEKTTVTSFIIRFKQEHDFNQTAPPWRGHIRHIQTSQETHFTNIEEALSFMSRFVALEAQGSSGEELTPWPHGLPAEPLQNSSEEPPKQSA